MSERPKFNPGYEYLEVPEILQLDRSVQEWHESLENPQRRREILNELDQGWRELYANYQEQCVAGNAANLKLLIRFTRKQVVWFDLGGMSLGRSLISNLFDKLNRILVEKHPDLVKEVDEEQKRAQGS